MAREMQKYSIQIAKRQPCDFLSIKYQKIDLILKFDVFVTA